MIKRTISFFALLAILGSSVLAGEPVSAISLQRGLTQSTFLSPGKKAPIIFTGLAVTWHQLTPPGTEAALSVKIKSENTWSEWQDLHPEIDGKGSENPDYPSAFIATNNADAIQYRVILKTVDSRYSPLIEDISFTYINSSTRVEGEKELKKIADTHSAASVLPKSVQQVATTVVGGSISQTNTSIMAPRIISRSEWGADESLREYDPNRPEPQLIPSDPEFLEKYSEELRIGYKVTTNENGKELTWPLEYPKGHVGKFIIHHTASTKNIDDPARAIRDIYYFHTISRGWGDIGYNYIIDQNGNIYEGRAGGDGVVGAHAGKYNVGSVGIAVLGNYQDNDVPDKVINALVQLINAKSAVFSIDAGGSSEFRGAITSNIISHRDVGKTTCPGDKLYARLETIRGLVNKGSTNQIVDRRRNTDDTKYNYSTAEQIPLTNFKPGSSQVIRIGIRNEGTMTWDANTYLVVNNNSNSQRMLASNGMIKSYPIGAAINPGQVAVFMLELKSSIKAGSGNIEVFPLINGSVRVEKFVTVPLRIESADYDYKFIALNLPKSVLKAGEKITATIELKNTGNTPWKKSGPNRVMLGTEKPRDHKSRITVLRGNRIGELVEDEVLPGSSGHFTVNILAPMSDGYYRENFAPVVEGVKWMSFRDTYIDIMVGESTKERPVRVGLSFKGDPVISASGKFELLEDGVVKAEYAANEKVAVSYGTGIYVISSAGAKSISTQDPPRFEPKDSGILRIDNWEHRPAWKPEYNDNTFRGALEIHWYENKLQVVNELHIENYLKGLAEISADDPYEKIKAVTILARTYARYYTGVNRKFLGAPYDLSDDPERSQKYLGYGFEQRNSTGIKAVRDTLGKVVTYQGVLIKTPYFSSDDGRTRSAEEVWGWKDTPYLASVDDPGCKGRAMAGHGVGLSGCGSKYWASQGKNYLEIIKYYFKGVEVS